MTKRKAEEYLYQGKFDRAIIRAQFASEFSGKPKFNADSANNLLDVVGRVEQDSTITDIRWMAYMLATVYLESSRSVKKTVTTKDKRGNLVTKEVKVWQNFAPVSEVGMGKAKDYGKPVKVTVRNDGKAVITEWDGDQWLVAMSGTYNKLDKNADPKQGFRADGQVAPISPVKAYVDEPGDEHYYFGRGYVQLTWWSNYAAAGKMLNRGLDFLLDPDLVNDPKTAYEVLSTGMRKGMAFANGRQFSQYFHDDVTDYKGARAMVNTAGADEVAGYAEAFERILFEARLPALVSKP